MGMMFDDIEVTPEEVMRYIAELFIRNMKSLETIQLLKMQINQMEELRGQIDALRKERDSLVSRMNVLEAENIQLKTKIKELEDANSVSYYKTKKRAKE